VKKNKTGPRSTIWAFILAACGGGGGGASVPPETPTDPPRETQRLQELPETPPTETPPLPLWSCATSPNP